MSDNKITISIRHIVISASSQWIIGRNLMTKCNLEYIELREIRLSIITPTGYIQINSYNYDSQICLDRFTSISSTKDGLPNTATLAETNGLQRVSSNLSKMNWNDVRRTIDRVHHHMCGHPTFSDMRTLLERNNLWSMEAQKYCSEMVASCPDCKASSTPPPNKRVFLSSMKYYASIMLFWLCNSVECDGSCDTIFYRCSC